MPSPTCTVNGSATANGVNVNASTTITIQLADLTGVSQWSIECIGTDDLHSSSSITSALSINPSTKTATLTGQSAGTTLIFRSKVNNGQDVNGNVVAAYSTTFAVYVLHNGLRLLATNETTEGSSSYGWVASYNTAQRAIGGTSPSSGTFTTITLTVGTFTVSSTGTWAWTQPAKTAITTAQAGTSATFTAQSAVAGTSVAGAAAGGGFTWTAGSAARLTSGNANGGGFDFRPGAGIGTGSAGHFTIQQSDGTTLYQFQSNGAVMWGKTVFAPSYYHEGQTTDTACTETLFQSQSPWASATGANRNPGNLGFAVPSPAAGGTAGWMYFQISGTERVQINANGLLYKGVARAYSNSSPNFGRTDVEMPSNANYTVSADEMAYRSHDVISGATLTATRDYILPLTDGAEYRIRNLTTGGQSIRAIGSSGTGITIANGAVTTVICNGTNYLQG